jgi:ABC-type phosphate/phosphonate transport system permease subunit
MSDDADRFAIRAWTVCGFVGGGLVGLFMAPDLQRRMRRFGVDQTEFGPALVIILVCAALGAFLLRRAAQR